MAHSLVRILINCSSEYVTKTNSSESTLDVSLTTSELAIAQVLRYPRLNVAYLSELAYTVAVEMMEPP